MTRAEFIRILEEVIEADPGTLSGSTRLADIQNWDSLAVIGFIAAADEHLAASVPAQKIYQCETIDQILDLLNDKLR